MRGLDRGRRRIVLGVVVTSLLASTAGASTIYVAPGGTGSGTSGAPFGLIQDALQAAQPGDTIVVRDGTYGESLHSVRAGAPAAPIVLKAEQKGGALVHTSAGTVLRIDHADLQVEGLVLDGDYGNFDAVIVSDAAARLVIRDAEVRRATKDCIDIRNPSDLLIERSAIHHCLNAAGGRTDAHGIVAGAVHNLTIRDTDIYAFSGDAVQVDPGRTAPGWDNVLIERCRLWLEPLATAENGFPPGTVPGENAVDTKTNASAPRANLTVRDTEAWGYRNGLITNMAAFNLKEGVNAVLDRVTVWNSEIAFRLRGPGAGAIGAWVRVQNAVTHDVAFGVRYEDNIESVKIYNSTFGAGVGRAFLAASSTATGLDVRNVLFEGGTKPAEASAPSNLVVSSSAFVSSASRDYHLVAGGAAIDHGEAVAGVASDRDGIVRPQGTAIDVGAYEYCVSCAPGSLTAPRNVRVIVP
ncbi:MAG: choice-of-anchor Q domain-containing protein [Vicinamibacterales bacterium]